MAGNSAYEELKKLANDIVSTGTVSKSSGATSTNGSGSGAASAGKSQSTADYFSSRRKALGLDRIKVDLDYINSFISDSQKHMNSTTSDKVRMGYGTSSSIYESRKKEYEDLHKRSFEIGRYLEANKDELDEGAYKSLKDYLDAFDKTSSQAIYAFYRNDKFISQFETEDDYLKWDAYSTPEKRKSTYEKNQTRLKELQEERSQLQQTKPGMNPYAYGGATNPGMPYGASQQGGVAPTSQQQTDTDRRLNEIEKEIASIESEMRMYERGNTDESGFYYGSKVVDDYSKVMSNPNYEKFSSFRNYYNPSRETMQEYDALTDQSGWYRDGYGNLYDSRGVKIDETPDANGIIQSPLASDSRYTVTDPLGLYLSTSEDERNEAVSLADGVDGSWEALVRDGYFGNWEKLTEGEVGIYYTLLGTKGKDAAMQYLTDMTTELNRRNMISETERYNQEFAEAGTLERIAMSLATTPAQLLGGATAFLDDVSHTIRGEDINPYSAAHELSNYAQTTRKNQAEAWDEATNGAKIPFINFTVGDLYQAGMSAVDMGVGSLLGGGAYEVLMGMGSASSEAKRLYEQGASKEQVAWGGALAGAAEMVFEHASIENLINLKDADTLGQFVKNLLIQGGIEASEEGFTDIANTITNAIVMGTESDWAKLVEKHGGDRLAAFIEKVQEVGSSAFAGFVSGGFGGSGSSVMSYAGNQIQNARTGKVISGANSTDALRSLALEMAKGASKGDKSRLTYQSNNLGNSFNTKTGKNIATGRLYNTVRSVVTEQNISEISTALQEKGISKKEANAIAGAVAVQANGMELTKDQHKVLEKFGKNETVQTVLNEILDNKDSGINQRARSVAKFEFDTMRNDIISRMNQEAPGQEKASASDTVDSNEESSSEASYEVSADGKTILKSTGEIVNIKNVAAIKDGKVTLNLEDGRSVNAADVSFSSNSEAIFYDTVAQMDASVKAANILVNSFNALQGDSVQAEVFARGVSEAFRYGKLGLPSAALTRSKFANELTVAQQDYVYRQGKKAAGKQVAQQQAVVNSVFNEAKATAKSGTYQAVLEDGITALSLNESQKASYRLADNIAQAAKVNIHVYLGKTAGERGYYNPSTDEIWLNLNATNQSRQSMMAFALGHELVHRAKKGSPGKYQAFTEFLMKEYGKSGASVEAMIQEELDAAKEFGIKMTEEQAFEEVVCNACERMLLDTDAGKRLAEFGAQSKENKSFLEDLKRWISEFLDKLRSIFQDVDPSSLAAKEFAKFDANAKKILADMYVDMTIDAGEKLSTIQNAFGKGTVVETNDHGEFTMARSADGSKVLNNLTTWNNGGRETLEATLLREGYTEDEVKAALTIMDEKQKLVESIANEVNDNGKMAFPEQGRINEATLTTDLKDGHSVLSALVSNGDYPVNIDLLMVCKKRKAYQRVINRLCETGMIKEATVDALAIAEINKILGKYGFETACLGCFVESRRLRIQEWAQTIVKEWNAEVKKRNPKAKPFGFGKGEASLTPDEVMQLIGELESGGEKNDQGNLNLGQGSAVKIMGVLLDKVPTLRRTLSIEDLITPDGLSSLRQFDSNLFSMVKSRYGSNSPKFVQEFNPYNHELAKYGKVPTEYSSLREYLYAIGGARMQSFSDFIIENWFDYCQIVADLAARKLPMHTYTKEIALARLFGLTGIKINMSLIPDVDRSLGKEYAGLTRNAKGELELIWADKDRFKKTGGKSYMQSINFADAIALQEDPRYSANVGTIAVGISDRHIRMMLADPRIRMVIPYHSSGMNPIFADLMGTSYYKDYTLFQNTTIKQIYNSKGQPVSLSLSKTQEGKLTGGFLFNSVLQELGDARAAAEAYKEWCADASKHTITIKGETYTAELTPKFNDFSGEENYYKLLEDFNTYDCITEQAAPQGDVQQNYPEGFEDILRAELSAQEGHRQKQEANKSFDKAMDEIEGYLKNHTKADTVHYANQHGIKLGAKDKKLSAEDKARLKELQKQGVSFMMPRSEPAPTFYSHMARVVDGVKQEKLGAASVVSMLRGKGVKAEEIKWSGIETFLEGKKSVTKAELQEFIAGSMLQIDEETLTDKEMPYSQEHLDLIAQYEAERNIIAENLKSEWKRIVGTDIPISYFGTGIESAVVEKLLEANSAKKGESEAGYKYKAARAALQRCIEYNDDYFGYDNERQAFIAAVRDPNGFMNSYEMTSFEKGVFRDFIKAKEAYSKVEGIPMQDQKALKAIAESADRFNHRISKVKSEHRAEAAKHMTKWSQYKIRGGENYREVLFKMPGSSYYNAAMDMHWDDRNGVLAHARIQDFNTFLGKMLFIEEIQSDWHNDGRKDGYASEEQAVRKRVKDLQKQWDSLMEESMSASATRSYAINEKMDAIDEEKNRLEQKLRFGELAPDAPFSDNYHEYVLKRLIRMAAEQDYDSIGWTPAEIQAKRWSEKFAEGYRIEYDQDIPKFLNKYGKKWGTKVGKTVLDNGTEVWSMAITDEMKESVLGDGQPLYMLPRSDSSSYQEPAYQEWDVQAALYDAMDHADSGDDNLIQIGDMPRYIVDKVGIEGDFYIYRNHAYENMVTAEQAKKDNRYSAKAHYHGLGIDKMTDAVMALENPIMTIATKTKDGNPAVIMLLPVEGKNKAPLYAVMSFYSNRKINGEYSRKPHIVLTIAEREFFGNNGRDGYAEIVKNAVKDGRVIDFDKKMRDSLSVIANQARVGDITVASLTANLSQFIKEIKAFREKNSIDYNLPVGEDTSPRALLSNALEAVTTNPIEKQKLQEYKEKVEMLNAEEKKLNELRKQIKKLSFSKGHYDADKVRELQFEANMTANRINTFDKQLLRLEASKPLQNVLTREKKMAYDRGVQMGKEALDAYRERAEKQQQEIVERYQESRKRGVENRHKTIMRQKLRKVILDLDKILNRGDKKRNVKEDMKGFVAEALYAAEILFMDSYTNEDMVRNGVGTDLTPEEAKFMNEARAIMDEISNLPSGSYDAMIERQEQEQKLKGRLAYRMARLKGVFIRERTRINKTQVSEVLGNLADAYGRLQNSEYDHVQGAYHENVHEYLKMLQEDVGGTIVKDMTLNQLEELYKAFTMVKTTVYNANRMFAENLNNTRDALANRVMFEVHEAGGEHGLWTKAGDRLNSFSWNNEKPVYAFERIGSKTLKTLYGNIRKGQDTWAVDLQEANDFRKALYEKYGHNTWDTLKTYKFTSSSGIDFELNLDQIMSLYAYSKRAQAHDHLLKGGFVFDGNTEVLVNKRGLKIPYLNKDATAYNLSFEILEDIISKLTDDQKAFADEMQAYLSSTMGEKGNEVSMQLYGVKLFIEQFYFPLRSAGQYMERAKEADMKKEQGQVNIANSGFAKATKIKASNPVVLSGFMDVWASHVNEMCMYHSFVLPMEDFRRVYNYSSPHMEGQQSASVNGVIQNAYGAAATDYIDKLYRDLNGGAITDNTTGVINKLMGLFKKGAVFASASVTVQQPSAIARATAMVDIKHFIGPKVDAKRHKALWEEVKQYAPVAIIKEMGFFDTNMGRSATDFLTAEEYSGIKEKALALVKDESFRDELLSKAPALADELTWCVIWEAVKRETKSKYSEMDVKSEEFLKIAGDRFSEVIDKTQVYDSVLARSANMRSKDTGMKMATAFMAEPTTSINMVADALRKGKKGNKKQAARIIGSVVASVILNSFLVAWVYAARDDDEDETFREKYISSFLSGIIDGVNPMTYIPFLKDIVSIVQGYDVERSDMAVISDLWNAYKQLEKDNVSAWRKVEGFAGSICQIFGLPVKNIMRDLRSLYQAYSTIVNGEENTARGTAYAIMEGITGQKPSKSDQLYNSRIAGDTKHAARIEARYDDEKSANAAVRKEITDRYMDGELTLAQATMQLTQYAGMEMDDAYWLMDSWKHKKETGSDEDYSKYNDFYEAVQTGKNLKAVIQEYTANGVNNKTLQSQITEHFKPEYVEMSAGERAKIKGYLINAYEQCGISREKAEERLRDWDFEAKNGFAYDDRKAAYMNGEISDTKLRTALIEYGGYSDEDADYQIKAYDWEKQGYEGVTVAAVKAYLQPIENLGYSLEDAGIPRDLYLEYRKRAAECTGVDANGDGKADSNSIKNQKMDVIDSMNLTSEQKDAMYFANGWAKGKLKNAPWH